MRLSPPCVGIEVGAGLTRLLDPPGATLRLNNRAQPPVQMEDSSVLHYTKNVHRAGRVSGGLLNPSGGARNRPRNKFVLAQKKNELNKDFASRPKLRLVILKKDDSGCPPAQQDAPNNFEVGRLPPALPLQPFKALPLNPQPTTLNWSCYLSSCLPRRSLCV